MSADDIEQIHHHVQQPAKEVTPPPVGEEKQKLRLEDFQLLKVIGKGSFGKVRDYLQGMKSCRKISVMEIYLSIVSSLKLSSNKSPSQ